MRIVMLLLGGAGLAAVRGCVQPLKLCVRTERYKCEFVAFTVLIWLLTKPDCGARSKKIGHQGMGRSTGALKD